MKTFGEYKEGLSATLARNTALNANASPIGFGKGKRILPSDAGMKGLIGPYARERGYEVGDDPDVYDPEGTKVQGLVISNDGKKLVVKVQEKGTKWHGKRLTFKITDDENMY